MPTITYYELSNYNEGFLIPATFELSGLTYNEHLAEVKEWLDELTEAHKEQLEAEIEHFEEKLLSDLLTDAERSLIELKIASKKQRLDYFYDYEEWIVCDYEDIPSEYVGEWSISPEFFEYLSLVESSHLDEEAIKAGVSLGIPLDKIEEAYYGHYESDEALAEEYIDSGCLGEIPDHLINYIDTERLGRDLAYDFLEEDGYYFYANY